MASLGGRDNYSDLTWHPNAVQKLGALISANVEFRNISMQEFAKQVRNGGAKISFNTIWRLSKGDEVTRPSARTLQRLAPHLYRATSYQNGVVGLDSSTMYAPPSGWLDLAKWACAAPFEQMAVGETSQALADFILDYCDRAGLTHREFEAGVVKNSGLTAQRLLQILGGADVFDDDLYWLSHLIRDEDDHPYSWQFWQDLRRGVAADAHKDNDTNCSDG
jgi:transcriptional regulator with XRE-family HTH domain